jgi:hypothetical protein
MTLLSVLFATGWIVAAIQVRHVRDARKREAEALSKAQADAKIAADVRDELIAEANYWRSLVNWQKEHPTRSPTQEELDAMWDRIIAQKPSFSSKPSVVIAFDGQLAHYVESVDALIRSTGGR